MVNPDPEGTVSTVLKAAAGPPPLCALPEDAAKVTVFDTFKDPRGCPLRGSVSFVGPDRVVLAAGVTIACRATAGIGSDGSFSVDLLATNAPGQTPNQWTYQVMVRLEDCGPCETYSIELPAGTSPVRLSLIPHVPPKKGEPTTITPTEGEQ